MDAARTVSLASQPLWSSPWRQPVQRRAPAVSRLGGSPVTAQRNRWPATAAGPRRPRMRTVRGSPVQALLSAEGVFTAATYVVMPVYTAILAAPRSRLTKTLVAPPFLFMIFALMYASVLPQVIAIPQALDGLFIQGSLFPQVSVLASLFEHKAVVAMAWVHLLMLDLFQARYVLLDGLRQAVPIQHSVILSFMFGPTGLICHLLTVYLFSRWRSQRDPA